MNLDLKSEKINYMMPVFKRRFTREETIEVIVPDSLPDILRILDTDGTPLLRSKDSDTGRVTITGVVEGCVLFIPENNGTVSRLEFDLPFSASSDDAAITSDCAIVAEASLLSAESRTLNPRKVLVKVEIACEVSCYTSKDILSVTGIESSDVMWREAKAEIALPTAVNEKTFIFTDSLRIPSEYPPMDDVLKVQVNLVCEDVKPVGNKAIIKGSAVTDLLYLARENGELRECRFRSPFSQVLDTAISDDPDDFNMYLMLTGAYISRDYPDDAGNDSLNLEVHAVAQCVYYVKRNISYISDAYSTKYVLDISRQSVQLIGKGGTEHISAIAKGTAQLPCISASTECISLKLGNVEYETSSEGTSLNGYILASLVYKDETGELSSFVKRLEFRANAKLGRPLEQAFIEMAINDEPTVLVTGSTAELKIPVDITVQCSHEVTLDSICGIEFDENKTIDISQLPSVVVIRVQGGQELWDIAKKYNSSEEAILSINGLESPNSIVAGNVLLIPRKR